MGNNFSVEDSHIRIYKNLLSINNPLTRAEMIQTLLSRPEYVTVSKRVGIYGDLLNYSAQVFNNKVPPSLPLELQVQQHQAKTNTSIVSKPQKNHIDRVSKVNSDEKAIGYFQACLEVLGLQEEVALNEDALKSAYKKAVLKNHPDKGGSEKEFEKVTRAYAYLGEILRRVHGGRSKESVVEAPNVLKDNRTSESKQWQHVDPVKLNPKKLDVNAFNKMFEQTRIPDPEEDGYGDWLKVEESSKAKAFSGKFNRDLFNKMFEDEAKTDAKEQNFIINQPQSMIMAPTIGVELGRGKPDSFTSAINANLRFTDLKQAYTTENNFSKQVIGVNVDNRNYETYKNDRGKAPNPLTNSELEEIQRSEEYLKKREEQRRIRAAQEEFNATSYFERMKQLVITDKSTNN
jgi:curved DNA-binding protein CbpA